VKYFTQSLTLFVPIGAKAEGLQSQGAEGEAAVIYCEPFGNALSEVLRLSPNHIKGRKDGIQ
jgi:hypothetical protein